MSLRSKFLAAVAGLALVSAAAQAQAAVVVSGPSATAYATTNIGGARFRALGTSASQEELYVGESDLGVGGNRAQGNVTYTQNGANPFSLEYDADNDTLTGVLKGTSRTYSNFLASLSPGVAGLSFNLLQIAVTDRAVGGLISLSNLKLNNVALSQPTLTNPDNTTNYWAVSGYDFKTDFKLTGDLNLSGAFSTSGEQNKVDILIGNAVPEPGAWALMIGGFGLAGAALRRRRAVATA